MSFTAEVKDELSRIEPKRPCCLKAELAALVRIEGTLHITGPNRYRLEVATETAPVARAVIKLLHGVYGLKTELTVRRSVLHKTNNYLITVPSQAKLAGALEELGILGEGGFSIGIDPKLVKRDCCAISYLRGAFLGGGSASGLRSLHLEIRSSTMAGAERLAWVAANEDVPLKVRDRGRYAIVYAKGAEAVADALALAGAGDSALAIDEHAVVAEARARANRIANADHANLVRASRAAHAQVQAIRTLEQDGRLVRLSPSLREIADLRLRHPSSSLRELAAKCRPPATKAAAHRRLARLVVLAGPDSRQP